MSTGSGDKLVLLRKDPETKVATITLNDPKRLNAMTADMGDAFVEVVDALCTDTADVGAVVVSGEGRAFSAGGDLKFLAARARDTPSRNAALMRKFYERFLCVRRLPVPVVAAINGPAIGAGLCFALACDVRVAAADAKLGITFVGLGLHPGMGATHFLPLAVGHQIASRMMLTGEVISGAEAARLGVVAEATEGDDGACLRRATELAAQMAAQAPIAVRTTVRSLRLASSAGLDRALWREADAQAQCYGSEKRKPVFTQYEDFEELDDL